VKRYPFEVPLPAGIAVSGVVLSDQIKSLDWKARRAEFASATDEATLGEVIARILPLIGMEEEG
jgi:mRNA interferase MazF